jgi:hypothetical protein
MKKTTLVAPMLEFLAADPDRARRSSRNLSALVVLASMLAGCNSGPMFGSSAPSIAATPNVAVTTVDLEGNWGLASYHTETDRPRTEAEAKSACGNPYQIGKGANGGVVMHLADQAQPQEVFLKVASDGRVFLGPRGPAGTKQDRVVVSFENQVLVTEWIDAGARERYGTMLFVRCSAPA